MSGDFSSSAHARAARRANDEDAAIWRWFSDAYEDRRLRWCYSKGMWFVSVDHKHLATEGNFDTAIRAALAAHRLAASRRRTDETADS